MAKGKLILICHSGGDFVTNDDGTMSYNGGEANAENVTNETPFNDIKLKLAEACDLDHKTVTIKYFLPGNKKNLIVMKNDKDVKRMIDFHGDAITAEVFVMGAPGFDRTILDIESNRESGGKKDDSLKKDETAKVKNSNAKKTKKDGKVTTSPAYDTPAKRTRRALAAAAADVASDDTKKGGGDKSGEDSGKSGGAMSEDSGDETSGSSDSDRGNDKPGSNSDSGSDFVPKRSSIRKRNNTSTASPADSVKKRRRTPSWKFGANGRPTIVSFPDTGAKPEKTPESRSSQRKSSRLAAKGDSSSRERKQRKEKDSDQESEKSEEKLSLAVCDDYALPETMVDAWQSAITGVGQEFDSVNEFRAALKKYAIANRFGYKFKKNDTSRAIGRCAAEGCTWKFYAAWVPTNQSFMIKTMTNSHSCDKESRKSAHPAKNWLVGTIKDRLKESPYLKPKEIANGILQDFGVELNYTQVWRGIGDAREQLHGSLKESYNKLPWFCEKVLETNPGSVAKLVVGDKKRFKSLFVCFHALIHGFKNGCRPLLFLESASMKSRYGETLLTAIAIDGNDGFIPVAFAVVDVEDDDTWRWFLEELKGSIMDLRPITFVVDRDKNLKKIVVEVFENAYIGYSIHHLLASFKRHMKGPFHGDGKAFLGVHLLAAAQAVRPIGFKKSTEHIKSISSQAHDWVVKIEPENYASPYFKGERYNHITEDVGETYTKLMEEYRHLPILQKIDALIRTMIDDVEDAKIDGTMWASKLTALKEKELEIEKGRARGLKVLISSDVIFEVREECTHVVNVGDWSCTCMGWKETGLPCRHAVAVLTLTGKNPYDFCSSYFTADAYRLTYAESISPVPLDGPPPLQIKTGRKWIVEGEKMEVQKVEGVEKEEGRKLEVEKDGGGNVDIVMEEGVKLDDDKKDEGSIVETEKDEGSIVETEKDEGNKVETEKDEGSKVETEKYEGSKVETEKDEGSKVEARKDEGSKVEGEKDEGSKVEGEKDEGSKVETGKDEGSKVESEKDEGRKVDTEKDEGSNVDAEKDEGRKLDVEKDEGSKVETEKDDGDKVETGKDEGSKVESEKDDGSKVETGEEEGGKSDVEKDDGGNVDTEMEEVTTLDGKKDEGAKVESEKDEGSKVESEKEEGNKVESEKEEGNKVETEKEEGEKLDVEKDGGVNVDTEMEESMKLDDTKDEGSKVDTEKDEGKMVLAKYEGGKLEVEKDEGKIREEHEDPNVFVLPPIPVKGPSMVKKEIEGVETEAEMKRKVTCSKCKQTGHYKKSCKI